MNPVTVRPPDGRYTSFIHWAGSFGSFEVMQRVKTLSRWRWSLPAVVAAVAVIAAACGGGTDGVPAVEGADSDPAPVASTTSGVTTGEQPADSGGASEAVTYDFPTGEAVLVPVGYEHPGDHVDNTGAFLPTNGKPTLVFVDAIW